MQNVFTGDGRSRDHRCVRQSLAGDALGFPDLERGRSDDIMTRYARLNRVTHEGNEEGVCAIRTILRRTARSSRPKVS